MTSMSSRGSVRKAHFTYVWAIENVSILTLTSTIRSPAFVVQTMDMTKWHLQTMFDFSSDQLLLFICREPDEWSQRFEIDFELSLFEEDEILFVQLSGTSQFHELASHRCAVTLCAGLIEHLPKKTLTVRCRLWRTGCEVLQSDLCFARTRMGEEQHSFVWAIKRFSTLRPGQRRAIFLHPTFKNLPTLILTFFLQELDGKEYGYITVHRNELTKTHAMDAEFSILDVNGWSVTSTKQYISTWITLEEEKVCEFGKFFERIEILANNAKFLSNDVLSLRCELEISAGPLWSRIENYRQLESSEVEAFASEMSDLHFDSSANSCCPLKQILKTLYEDGTLSDISLRAVGRSFSVHKNILSARSAVFKAMFTKDMKEMTAKYVDILDLNAETLRRLLLYIYTNRMEELQWEGAVDLFRAADKYLLLDLREICSNILKAKISASNVCDILVLADMYHDEELRKAVQLFISEDSDIFDSDAWRNLKEEHTKLAFETTEQIIKSWWY